MKKKIFTLLIVMVFALSLEANDNKKILDLILKYNYGIIKMGKSGETQFFREFVERDAAIKLQVWFESWKFSNLTYIAEINDMRFSKVTYNENNATLKSQENWTFAYVNLATREIALEPVTMFYEMEYTFVKHGDKWMISNVKHIKEEVFEQEKMHQPNLELLKEKSVQESSPKTP